ncbi:MAG: glutamate-1-semialdehyde 2,1-aminomutase [Firmicutes bacterium]|nr:glutamate-1-semialdehyde 2,1-aminomutase [Bacillota bacterium]
MDTSKSEQLFNRAKKYMPGGVNSPVRAFKAVGMNPLMIKKALGSKIYDVDGNQFIDYVCSWGPLILGHSHPEVVQAICAAAQNGTSYGACCEQEIELAQMICEAFPAIDKVRLVNSGTEATMSAVRLARAFTSRDKIIKFEGCYHGHADSFLIKAGSGLLTSGIPNSAGVPKAFIEQTLVCKYNDLESVKKAFMQSGPNIAAVIVEPIAANMGLVTPNPGFLEGLREITRLYGSLLIFDEVITGFRIGYGGVQTETGIGPDLTTLGKIIGGGLPVGAYGGRREIMDRVAPSGDVYQAGTLSGNPLAMGAGIATLKRLQSPDFYARLAVQTICLTDRLQDIFSAHGVECTINRSGSMFSIFFTEQRVFDYESVLSCDTAKYARFFRGLLQAGIYFPPSQFEVCFLSGAHSQDDLDKTAEAVHIALNTI